MNMLFEFSLQYLEQIWMTQVTASYKVGLISIRIWCYRNWISVRFRVCQELNRLLGRLKTIRYLRMRLEQKYFFQTEGERQRAASRCLLFVCSSSWDCSRLQQASAQFAHCPVWVPSNWTTEQADILKSMSWYTIWHIFVPALCLQTAAPSHCWRKLHLIFDIIYQFQIPPHFYHIDHFN